MVSSAKSKLMVPVLILLLSQAIVLTSADFHSTMVCPIVFTTASLLGCPYNRDPICQIVYYFLLVSSCVRYRSNYLDWKDLEGTANSLKSLLEGSAANLEKEQNTLVKTAGNRNENNFLPYQ